MTSLLTKRPPSTATFLTPSGLHLDPYINLDIFTSYVEVLRPVLRDLRLLNQDLRREEVAGLTPIYCLDFSEIHDLIEERQSSPTAPSVASSVAPATSILESQLSRSERQFALLPGTVFELYRFLQRILDDAGIGTKRRTVASGRGTATLSLANIKGFPERMRSLGLPPEQPLPNLAQLRAATNLLTQRTNRFGWLLQLIDAGRLLLVHEQAWFHHITWPAAAYDKVYGYLSVHRGNQPSNNEGDALNYALCIGASNLYAETGEIYYIIARGHTVDAAFSSCYWLRDPLAEGAAYEPTSLHRDPAYLLLRTHWEPIFREEPDRAGRKLAGLIHGCHDMLGDVQSLRRFARQIPGQSETIIDLSIVPVEPFERIQSKARRFNRAHASHMRSLFLAWETIRRTYRHELPQPGPETLDVEELTSAALKFATATHKAKTVQTSLHRMKTSARTAIEELRGRRGLPVDFKSTSVDRFGVEVTEISGILKIGTSADDSTSAHQETVLRIDSYADYFSAWWNASIDLHTFFDWVDYYVTFAGRLASQLNLAPSEEKLRGSGFALVAESQEGEPRRFQLVSSENEYIFPLDLFARSSLLGEVTRKHAVSIRLFTPYGDFWHNFRAQLRSGARMGIISHLCLPEFLAEFVSVTSVWPLSGASLKPQLRSILESFLPIEHREPSS